MGLSRKLVLETASKISDAGSALDAPMDTHIHRRI
jgi:hypothetical protein